MPSIRIARAFMFAVAAGVFALALIRFVQDVPNPEGGGCGPGWTTEYEGPCDSALKARQYEAAIEALLTAGLVTIGGVVLRDPENR
ncbi:MAG TPA: hypothetical protein VM347_05740 [Nonomuraea sp.]|nr:hypothetical protein [Nonomuraea sp.]